MQAAYNFDDADDLRAFVRDLTNRAILDHNLKARVPTGRELLENAFNNRKGHIRMASGLYRKIRWTLELRDNGKSNL